MSIKEIIDTNSNIQLVISAADLKEFALELLAEREKSLTKSNNYLTIAETVEKYGISKPTLWRWSKIGYKKPFKLSIFQSFNLSIKIYANLFTIILLYIL